MYFSISFSFRGCAPTTAPSAEQLKLVVEKLDSIMSAISEFATKQAAFNTQIDAAVTDIATEISNLNTQIAALQNSSGEISPEDQALLDGLETSGQALAAKVQALDTLTPPAVPVAPAPATGDGAGTPSTA